MTALSRHKIRGKLCKRLHSPSKIQSFYLFWVKGDVRGVPGGQGDVHVVPGGQGVRQGCPRGASWTAGGSERVNGEIRGVP